MPALSDDTRRNLAFPHMEREATLLSACLYGTEGIPT